MIFNSNKINLSKFVMLKFRIKFKIKCMMKREPLLFHLMLKQRVIWFTLASSTQETVKVNLDTFPEWISTLKLPKDTIDMDMTIWTVDGIHTYRRDRMTQAKLYSP